MDISYAFKNNPLLKYFHWFSAMGGGAWEVSTLVSPRVEIFPERMSEQ